MPDSLTKLFQTGPVYPLPAAFHAGHALDTHGMAAYIHYLQDYGATIVMTTAGTTRFSHLTDNESGLAGRCLADFAGTRIVGVPPLPLARARDWMTEFALDYGVDAFLVLYPDRYYDDATLWRYFTALADKAPKPVLIHAAPLRQATGGTWDYTPDVLRELSQHPNIVGCKEEASTLAKAYELSRCASDAFVCISAGGSGRRFTLTHVAGAQTYLAGVGSFFPRIEEELWRIICAGTRPAIRKYLQLWEEPLFDAFMPLGWHAALTYGLKYMGLLDSHPREPWPLLAEGQKKTLEETLDMLQQRL
jgi:dihydrodipicolinate synthase/N-acetylneuraminate lyase